jgi:SpoVK/Ycf46/Vps4 family AAA+-type ATPase
MVSVILYMLNKKNKVNPKRINNYNKFLSTLDNGSLNIKNNVLNEKNDNNITKNNISENNIIEQNKTTIDNIINSYSNNFILNGFSSNIFTGFMPSDLCCINYKDPNYYRDMNTYINSYNPLLYYNIANANTFIKEEHKITKKELIEKPVEIVQTINIDIEINNISDILTLIKTYKLDPTIKYNINMKALHDIAEPLEDLNNMIGMKYLKNNIVDQILFFVQELHKNKNGTGDFMHTVIYGSPGTGKTEIAKIIGKIYSKIGILKKGTFKKVTRSDLISGYLGQTALKTQDVIKEALGGVLFIDEAYSLGSPEKRDSFAKECVDTLCEALSDNKDNLMVIIAGYEKELNECFFKLNQGLDSRFTWRFKTDEYQADDLYNIFLKKVKDIGWELDTTNITVDWFKKNKEYFRFYGRDIESILAKTKIAHGRRVFCKSENEKKKIILQDLEKGFEIYLNNEDIKNKKNENELKKYLNYTLYS